MVVHGRHGEVDLRRPVRRVPPVRTPYPLEPLDQVPPARVVVGVGVGIEAALEVRHDEHPPCEDEQRRSSCLGEAGRERVDVGRADPGDRGQPAGSAREASEQHGDALGRERVCRLPQEPGEGGVELAVVHGVAELVEHRLGPPLVGLDVAQDAHVALAVDVDAERVLALPLARVEVAPGEHGPRVEADAVVAAHGEGLDVGVLEEGVEVDGAADRRVLEIGGLAAEPLGERGVEARLPFAERCRGRLLHLVEGGEQSPLVELAGGQREGEVVAVAEPARRLVPETGELANAVGDLGADLLRRLPCRPPRRRVVARAQHIGDRVVVDPPAVDLAAEGVERRLDLDLELDDVPAKFGVDLVRSERVVEHVELAGHERVELVRLPARRFDGAERVRVAQQLASLQLDALPALRRFR